MAHIIFLLDGDEVGHSLGDKPHEILFIFSWLNRYVSIEGVKYGLV